MTGTGNAIYFIGTIPPLLLALWLILIALAARDPRLHQPHKPRPGRPQRRAGPSDVSHRDTS